MSKLIERRRKPRRKTVRASGPTWVMLENVQGARTDIRAKVVDFNETGIRIHVSLPLRVNHIVLVKSQAPGVVPDGRATARVVDCRALIGTGYTAGLTFQKADSLERDGDDYYEILQVSRKADPQTIQGIYEFQAQRFHPGNQETGDAGIFQAIEEAYEVLSDPVKRRAYDVSLQSYATSRWQVLNSEEQGSKERDSVREHSVR